MVGYFYPIVGILCYLKKYDNSYKVVCVCE